MVMHIILCNLFKKLLSLFYGVKWLIRQKRVGQTSRLLIKNKIYKTLFLGRLPLYVQNLPVLKLEKQSEVVCGTSYTLLVQTPTRTLRYLPVILF